VKGAGAAAAGVLFLYRITPKAMKGAGPLFSGAFNIRSSDLKKPFFAGKKRLVIIDKCRTHKSFRFLAEIDAPDHRTRRERRPKRCPVRRLKTVAFVRNRGGRPSGGARSLQPRRIPARSKKKKKKKKKLSPPNPHASPDPILGALPRSRGIRHGQLIAGLSESRLFRRFRVTFSRFLCPLVQPRAL